MSTEIGTTVERKKDYKLEYFTEFSLFQAWTWRLTMLQIYVTLWGSWFACMCLCVRLCVSVYLVLLSHFLPFKIHLKNILPILIKMVDFKNPAWATSFATRASRKFIYLPYKACEKKSYYHTLVKPFVPSTPSPTPVMVSSSWLYTTLSSQKPNLTFAFLFGRANGHTALYFELKMLITVKCYELLYKMVLLLVVLCT